jgi:hypothetical protein
MTLTFNEGKACDAVIRVLEAREGANRYDVRFPEQEGHAAPIEVACHIGDRLFAFEHTGIEPFPGHMQMEREADWLFGPSKPWSPAGSRLPTHSNWVSQSTLLMA